MNIDVVVALNALEHRVAAYKPAVQASKDDVFAAVWGDDFRALEARDRARAFIILPAKGPYPAEGTRCRELMDVNVCTRWPVSKAGRDRMLTDIRGLREWLHDMPRDVDGLYRVTVGTSGYRYSVFPGANTAMSVTPVTLDYHVEV